MTPICAGRFYFPEIRDCKNRSVALVTGFWLYAKLSIISRLQDTRSGSRCAQSGLFS
jgi:hypothetical protein